MAKEQTGKRKPRIRKTAPTVRELAESRSDDSKPKGAGALKRIAKAISKPFRLVFGADKLPGKGLRFVLKPFAWLGRKLVPKYFINSWRELRQVTWPGRIETWRLTLAVFVFATIFGTAIYGVDLALDRIFKETVLR